MIRRSFVLLLAVSTVACSAALAPSPPLTGPAADIAEDVAYLASPALEGRAAGSEGDDSATLYIARRYQQLGLNGGFRSACAADPRCAAAYFQFFRGDGWLGRNIAAVVAGTDSTRRDEYIVVGAHFDHLGNSPLYARDPELGITLRPGADDNASGTAALLELGRRFAARPPPCSVLLVHFDAEELGLIGSNVFVHHLPVPRRAIALMVNLDMVGRLRTGGLTIDPSALSKAEQRTVRPILDSAAARAGIHPRYSSVIADRSDHASFRRVGIPAVALFTGFHSDYHRASDIPSRVDAQGTARIVDMMEEVVRACAGERAPDHH